MMEFTKVTATIEGYLSDNNKADVLFVLKEPHSENQTDFWFRRMVNSDKPMTRYINILGSLAGMLLGRKYDTLKEKQEILKDCAYMNIFPFHGGSTASADYDAVFDELKALNQDFGFVEIKPEDKAETIAQNRNAIIRHIALRHNSIIVTTEDIFNKLAVGAKKCDWLTVHYTNNAEKKTKTFKCAELDNGIRIFSFWHPAYSAAGGKLDDKSTIEVHYIPQPKA